MDSLGFLPSQRIIFCRGLDIRVAEGVRTEAVIHAKQLPAVKNDPLEPLLIHGIALIRLLGKQPGFGFHMTGAGIPVIPDILADALRDGDITV